MSILFMENFQNYFIEVKIMYERIKKLAKERGITINSLESELGFSRGSLSKIDKNKPSVERLIKLAEFFNVQVDYLTGDSEYKTKKEMFDAWDTMYNKDENLAEEVRKIEKGIRIPVLGNVAAGVPIEVMEDVLDWEEIPEDMASKGEHFGLKIKGDSMSPRILEGDVVIVRSQSDANSGDIVIAKVNGDDVCCKKLIKYDNGINLISFNPMYEPMYFSAKDIQSKPVNIIGIVVELRGKI